MLALESVDMLHAFNENGDNLCGVKKPTTVKTQNKALTGFCFGKKTDTTGILDLI